MERTTLAGRVAALEQRAADLEQALVQMMAVTRPAIGYEAEAEAATERARELFR